MVGIYDIRSQLNPAFRKDSATCNYDPCTDTCFCSPVACRPWVCLKWDGPPSRLAHDGWEEQFTLLPCKVGWGPRCAIHAKPARVLRLHPLGRAGASRSPGLHVIEWCTRGSRRGAERVADPGAWDGPVLGSALLPACAIHRALPAGRRRPPERGQTPGEYRSVFVGAGGFIKLNLPVGSNSSILL
ncbi:hypothetical protein NDU88_011081 [Pleurodeles waltl]|uniref:Uncharacterized protein n=1 Tax=Pleurodeles waltl TaxID=8319 RepID=A0AAV7S033_PLEWA|nr:hypothetical protein NDU88_011081 [Pleurodeles waltl]